MNKCRFRFVYSLSVLALALPLALTHSAISVGHAEGLFVYSNGSHLAYINGGDLLSKSGIAMNESEVNYLNSYDNLKLSYSEAFYDDDVKTSIIDETLFVFAHEKSYTDLNNRVWTWVPVSIGNTPFVIFDNLYVAELPNSASLENVDIKYELTLDISEQVFNSFINKSYEDAVGLNNIYEQYLADEAYYERRPSSEEEYQQQLAEYNDYLEAYQAYLNKQENYEAYLAAKAKYDEAYEKYNQYLLDKAEYESLVIAYKQYQEKYADWLENHERMEKDYNEYQTKNANARYQLQAMQIAYEQDTSQDRSMASYILSSTVADVLARKDELSVLGVPGDLVDSADNATVKLRTSLREYDNLINDEARYSYYFINYNYIKSNANILLRSLERLVRYPSVKNLAQDRGKYEGFITLIFQLMYFANAVSDTVVYNYEAYNPITNKGDMSKPGAAILDENFTIEGKTYKSWLKGYDFIDTSKTATPTSGILPTQPPVPPAKPEPVEVPAEPTIVQKPIAPTPVSQPIQPEEVLKPIPYDPDALPPEYPAILENEINAALLGAYRAGNVVEKTPLTESITITIYGNRTVNVSSKLANVAVFHNYLDEPIQYVFFVEGVEYHGETPTRPADQEFTAYYFDYWSDEHGENPNKVNLKTLDVSKKLYPVFDHGERQRYQITWIYPDGAEVTEVVSESIPSAPCLPFKEETEEHYYVFSGWSPELEPADQNATYTAMFDELDIFDVTYVIDGHEVVNRNKENYLPNPPQTYEVGDGTYYVIKGWEEPLSKITGDTTYHAIFDKYYTITWNILGEVSTERYLEGTPITFKGNIPEPIREETYYRQFEFDQALGVASSNRTITANYVNHNYLNVVLKIDGYTIYESCKYLEGEEVVLPSSYNAGQYHYDISGWSKSGSTYTASYTKTPLVSGDDVVIGYIGETLKIDVSSNHQNDVNLSYLLGKVQEGEVTNSPLRLIFENGEVNLTSTQVSYLALRAASTIRFDFADLGDKSYSMKVVVLDQNGQEISIPDFTPEISIKKNIDYLHSQVYLNDEEVNAELSEDFVRLRARINTTYTIVPAYSVAIRASNSVAVTLSSESARVGEKIHLDYVVEKGYAIEQISAYTRSGDPVEIDSKNDIVIPADDVVVNFICKKLQYTLKLYVDDALYASYVVNYGDKITLPTYIKKVGTETEEFIFTGWGIQGESISITEDTVLHAEFMSVAREQGSKKQTSNIVKIAGYVAVGSLTVGLGVGLFFIFRKIRKH